MDPLENGPHTASVSEEGISLSLSEQFRGTSSEIHRPMTTIEKGEKEHEEDEEYHHLLEAHEDVDYDDDEDDDEGEVHHTVLVQKQVQGLSIGSKAMTATLANATVLPSPPLSLSGAMDDEGRAKRNRMLIQHMLQLDSPVVTDKMVEFFYQEGVCELFVSFITQVPEPHPDHSAVHDLRPGPRAEKGDPLSPEEERTLEKSFRAVQLLSPEEPTNSLSTFLGRKAGTIIESVFEVFQPYAKGSYHHACRIIDYLLRYYTDQVYLVIGRSAKSVRRYLGAMVKCLEYSPVAETMVKLVCCPAMNAMGHYKATPANKWKTYESLAEWRLLLVLGQEVYHSDSTVEHSSCCADVFVELMERLAGDENGELLLQPLGHCTELIDNLMECVLDKTMARSRRRDCSRVLVGIALKTAEAHVPSCGQPFTAFGTPAMVINQLKSIKPLYFHRLSTHLQPLCDVLGAEGSGSGTEGQVRHPGYVTPVPFTYLRFLLVNLLVEIVLADSKRLLAKVPLETWRVLINWFFHYPHSNLYHSLFYKFMCRVVRINDEVVLQTILKKARLVSHLVDHFSKSSTTDGNRGFILQLCNVLRLQAATLPPSSWLRSFLQSHDPWRKFLPQLRSITEKEQEVGLGIAVPTFRRYLSGQDLQGVPGLGVDLDQINEMTDAAEVEIMSIDLGSAYARSLGFVDDVEYSVEDTAGGSGGHGASKKKKKKKKKGGKQNLNGSKMDMEEPDHDEEGEDEEGVDTSTGNNGDEGPSLSSPSPSGDST